MSEISRALTQPHLGERRSEFRSRILGWPLACGVLAAGRGAVLTLLIGRRRLSVVITPGVECDVTDIHLAFPRARHCERKHELSSRRRKQRLLL